MRPWNDQDKVDHKVWTKQQIESGHDQKDSGKCIPAGAAAFVPDDDPLPDENVGTRTPEEGSRGRS